MFKTNYNAKYSPRGGEFNQEPSMTVPDMALSVHEMLVRFTNNTLGNIAKTPYYEENPSFDTIDETNNPDYDLADFTADSNTLSYNKLKRKADIDNNKKDVQPQKTSVDEKEDNVETSSENS